MEVNTQRRATGLKEKIPDIQKTLDTVWFLKAREVRPEGPPSRIGHDLAKEDPICADMRRHVSPTRTHLRLPLS